MCYSISSAIYVLSFIKIGHVVFACKSKKKYINRYINIPSQNFAYISIILAGNRFFLRYNYTSSLQRTSREYINTSTESNELTVNIPWFHHNVHPHRRLGSEIKNKQLYTSWMASAKGTEKVLLKNQMLEISSSGKRQKYNKARKNECRRSSAGGLNFRNYELPQPADVDTNNETRHWYTRGNIY